MPLSRALLHVLLRHACPHCGHELERKGSYFQTVGHYRCETCEGQVRIGYEDKVELFEKHAHLT
jgi:transposase-like protein